MHDPRSIPTATTDAPNAEAADAQPADLQDAETRREAEFLLRAVPGVELARLVPGDDRPVDALHLLVQRDATPSLVLRDVETMMFTRLGLTLDRQVVNIAQLGTPEVRQADTVGRGRPALEGVVVASRRSGTTVTVELLDEDGRLLEGSAEGDEAQLRTLVAQAALRAAEQQMAPVRASLGRVSVMRVGDVDTVLVTVQVHALRGDTQLVGSAPLRDGLVRATARATLNAVNRTLERPPAAIHQG